MSYKCVGCDGVIPWDGKGAFAYTCPCGASLFYDEETLAPVMPASLIFAIDRLRRMGIRPEGPHIDYYLGDSNLTSEIKEAVTEQLLEMGFIWMKDCKQCQEDGTYAKKLDREKRLLIEEAERILGGESQ